MHKYKIDKNACFDCSFDDLSKDLLNCMSQQASEIYFDNTKKMQEFGKSAEGSGKGKFCVQCTKQCDYVGENVEI